jgi:hypothetical protein
MKINLPILALSIVIKEAVTWLIERIVIKGAVNRIKKAWRKRKSK